MGGPLMGAWFVPLTPTETRVTFVTQRRMKTNMFAVLTESTYHERFSEAAVNASRLVSRSQMRQRTDEDGKPTWKRPALIPVIASILPLALASRVLTQKQRRKGEEAGNHEKSIAHRISNASVRNRPVI